MTDQPDESVVRESEHDNLLEDLDSVAARIKEAAGPEEDMSVSLAEHLRKFTENMDHTRVAAEQVVLHVKDGV